MRVFKRMFAGLAAAAVLTVALPFAAAEMPGVQGAELEATEWELYVDYGIFAVCATSCPDGAEESEYCCWIPSPE